MTSIPRRRWGQTRPDESCRSTRARRRTAFAVLVVAAFAGVSAVAASATGTIVASSAKKPAVAPKRQAAPALPKRCTELGIYRDDPIGTFPALVKSLGANVTTISTYVTAGNGLDPRLVALARARGLRLLITWMPDDGTDETYLPGTRWPTSPAECSTTTSGR